MGLLSGVAPAVESVIRAAINDPILSRTIIYKRFTGQTVFNAEKGYPEDQYEPITLKAACLTHSERSIRSAGLRSSVQAGDHVYVIREPDLCKNGLTQAAFSQKDIILDQGEERKITNLNWALSFAVQVSVAG